MTPTTLIHNIESYYGKYKAGTKKVVTAYLDERQYSPDTLHAIWRELVLTVSGQYSFTPDVAIIEKVYRSLPKTDATTYRGLPDPTIRSMKIETGEMLNRVLSNVSMRRKRENEEVTG